MIQQRRALLLSSLALALPLGKLALAQGTPWPEQRPIRLVVGFPPGGSLDVLARILAENLAKTLGATVIVENRTGAAGMLAAEEVSRQAPDGHTLILVPGGPLKENPAIDIFDNQSFTQISRLTESPNLLAVGAPSPYNNFRELLNDAKPDKQPVSYASSGIGSLQHLVGEMIAAGSGANLNHVPYRGGGQAVTDLIAGHVGLGILGLAPLYPHLQSGKLRALAVSSANRLPGLPNVPTLIELGLNIDATSWTALYGPKNLPPDVTATLAEAVQHILEAPETRAKLEPLGIFPAPLAGEAFTRFARADRDRQLSIVRDRNITLQ